MDKNDRIFQPNGVDIITAYPELQNFPALVAIKKEERNFVWWFACKDSPASVIADESERVLRIIQKFPKYKLFFSDEAIKDISKLKFPSHIEAAIEVMKTFDPETRARGMRIVDKIFAHAETVVNKEMPDDYKELKSFMDIQLSIARSMPDLLQAVERGYGYRAVVSIEEEPEVKESKKPSINIGDLV